MYEDQQFLKDLKGAFDEWNLDSIENVFSDLEGQLMEKDPSQHSSFLQQFLPIAINYLPMLSPLIQKELVRFIAGEFEYPGFPSNEASQEDIVANTDDEIVVKPRGLQIISTHREDAEKVVLKIFDTLSAAQREKVCDAFHYYVKHMEDREQTFSSKLAFKMGLREIPSSSDNFPTEEFITELFKNASQNLVNHYQNYLNVHSGHLRRQNLWTAALLETVLATANKLYIDDNLLREQIPFMVRKLANSIYSGEDERLISLQAPFQEASYKEAMLEIATNFYPKLSDTLEKWDELKGLAGSVNSQALELTVIDGKDLVALESHNGYLKDSPTKLFMYDNEKGIYANGMVEGWLRAIQLGNSEEPLTIENFDQLYEIIGNAANKKISYEEKRVGFNIHKEFVTAEGFEEIQQFISELNDMRGLGYNAPRLSFTDNFYDESRVENPSFAMAKKGNLYLSRSAADEEALKKVINNLVNTFNDELAQARTLEEAETAALRVSKKLQILHPGHDANGRICDQLWRSICLMRAQRKFERTPTICTLFNPYKIDLESLEQGMETLKQATALREGRLKLGEVPLPQRSPSVSEEDLIDKESNVSKVQDSNEPSVLLLPPEQDQSSINVVPKVTHSAVDDQSEKVLQTRMPNDEAVRSKNADETAKQQIHRYTISIGAGMRREGFFRTKILYPFRKFLAALGAFRTKRVSVELGEDPTNTKVTNPTHEYLSDAKTNEIKTWIATKTNGDEPEHINLQPAPDKSIHIKGANVITVDINKQVMFFYDAPTNQVIVVPAERLQSSGRTLTQIDKDLQRNALVSFKVPARSDAKSSSLVHDAQTSKATPKL